MVKKSQLVVDMAKATTKWKPVVEKLGITNPDKIANLCEYAEMHSQSLQSGIVKENVMYANPANTAGMGPVVVPGMSGIPGMPGGAGSGDLGQVLLPASLKIAAHTIGLELLPMINVNSNRVDLLYWDWTYDDTNADMDAEDQERASTFKFKSANAIDAAAVEAFLRAQMTAFGITEMRGRISAPLYFHLSDGVAAPNGFGNQVGAPYDPTVAPGANKLGWFEFRGFSRIDGWPMFRAFTQANAASTGQWGYGSQNSFPLNGSITALFAGASIDAPVDGLAASGVDIDGTATGVNASLVSLGEDFVDGFTTNRKKGARTRGDWDVSQAGKIGPRSEVKYVEIGVADVSAALRLSEIGDWKRMYNVDIVEKTREKLVQELTQQISIEIVEKVKEMGLKNRAQAPAAPAAVAAGLATGGITDGKVFDLSVSVLASALNGEHNASIATALWRKVIQASYFMATDGRLGGADYIVTSGTVLGILQSVRNYTINPMDGKLAVPGQIQSVGSIDGIKIYVDPYMMPGDQTIFLGRVGTKEDPGLKFCAYMLAESVEVVSEKNMAPHMYMYSRYAITEFGYFPEKQYMAIKVEDVNGLLL
jgi:hypothetical protein